jgi:hypothetical protein
MKTTVIISLFFALLWYRINDRWTPYLLKWIGLEIDENSFEKHNDHMSWVVHYKLAHSLFETDYSVEIMSLKNRFVICLYYTMTTLNTIGYGDFHPQNQIEMVINIVI